VNGYTLPSDPDACTKPLVCEGKISGYSRGVLAPQLAISLQAQEHGFSCLVVLGASALSPSMDPLPSRDWTFLLRLPKLNDSAKLRIQDHVRTTF
jgi:hypothetical protein